MRNSSEISHNEGGLTHKKVAKIGVGKGNVNCTIGCMLEATNPRGDSCILSGKKGGARAIQSDIMWVEVICVKEREERSREKCVSSSGSTIEARTVTGNSRCIRNIHL